MFDTESASGRNPVEVNGPFFDQKVPLAVVPDDHRSQVNEWALFDTESAVAC
jgi:hypothetical protein